MSFSHVTHHMGKVADTNQYKVVRVTPIIRLGNAGAVVYLQSGKCWDDGGKEMELPGWAYEAMRRLTPAALKEAGFDKLPEAPTGLLDKLLEPDAPVLWQCPDCGKMVQEGRAKVAHIDAHNKHLDAASQIPNKRTETLHAKH